MVSQYGAALQHLELAHRLLGGPDDTSLQLRALIGRMMDCMEKAERARARPSNVIDFPRSSTRQPSDRIPG